MGFDISLISSSLMGKEILGVSVEFIGTTVISIVALKGREKMLLSIHRVFGKI